MKNEMLEKLTREETEYKEECVFTSIDIFSGLFDYLSFYYICEICFNDFWFVSPYHCYFFVRSKFKKKKLAKSDLSKIEIKEDENNRKRCEKADNEEKQNDVMKFFQSEEIIQLFEKVDFIYYEDNEMIDIKKEQYQVLIDAVNKCTIAELKEISYLFSENPTWQTNKHTWLEAIIRDKFRRNERMRVNLGNTGNREIVYKVHDDETETIRNKRILKDYYFLGVMENKGQNMLGRIYMNIRTDILKNHEIYMWAFCSGNLQTDENLLPDIYIEETYFERILNEENNNNSNNNNSNNINDDKLKHIIAETKKEFSDKYFDSSNISVEKKTRTYSFENKEYISFGKNEKNDIICLNPSISRFHCILYFCKDYHLYLMDVGSKARTKLNNVLCEINKKYQVKNNDILNLGVSKRSYKIRIEVTKVLDYLNAKQKEINNRMESIHQEMEQPKVNKKMVKIKNIYYKCNENDLLDFFRDCGPIRNIKLFRVRDTTENVGKGYTNGEHTETKGEDKKEQQVEVEKKQSKKVKGTLEALVELYDEETAENIMRKNDCFLYGQQIHISYQPLEWNSRNENWRNRGRDGRGRNGGRFEKREGNSQWRGKGEDYRNKTLYRKREDRQGNWYEGKGEHWRENKRHDRHEDRQQDRQGNWQEGKGENWRENRRHDKYEKRQQDRHEGRRENRKEIKRYDRHEERQQDRHEGRGENKRENKRHDRHIDRQDDKKNKIKPEVRCSSRISQKSTDDNRKEHHTRNEIINTQLEKKRNMSLSSNTSHSSNEKRNIYESKSRKNYNSYNKGRNKKKRRYSKSNSRVRSSSASSVSHASSSSSRSGSYVKRKNKK